MLKFKNYGQIRIKFKYKERKNCYCKIWGVRVRFERCNNDKSRLNQKLKDFLI